MSSESRLRRQHSRQRIAQLTEALTGAVAAVAALRERLQQAEAIRDVFGVVDLDSARELAGDHERVMEALGEARDAIRAARRDRDLARTVSSEKVEHGQRPVTIERTPPGERSGADRTRALDEDGDEELSLAGQVSTDLVLQVLDIQRRAFEKGQRNGRAMLAGEFRLLMDCASAE